ncbi:hypothetical protein ACI79C_24040 [Geodermatophilus sp. SYSU D00697]
MSAVGVARGPRAAEPPGERLTAVVDLVDELAGIARATDRLVETMQEVTGVRRGEIEALQAVADGARHPREVARRTGQVDHAADATTEALVRRGLLHRAPHPDAPALAPGSAVLEVTEAGRVVLQQAEGVRIRVLDRVVGALGRRDTAALRASVRALAGALATGVPGGPGPALPVES